MPSRNAIEVPQKALPDLRRIAELSESLFNSFLAAIGETDPTLTRGQFAKKIAEKVPLMEPSDIGAILGTAFILYSIRMKSGMALSAQALADGVANSTLIANANEFTLETKKILSDRIVKLVSDNRSLGVTSKAFDVMTENERTFCAARILSDIRPIFAENPETADAAVIIHNLQIAFHQNGKHQEFYVALDTDDIEILKKVIVRAERKTAALQAILKKSHVPYLEV
jgi:hypothetical protein